MGALSQFGTYAQALLTMFVDALTTLGVDLPESQYVSAGQVAWDGPSMTIELGTITQGQPGRPVGDTFQPASVTITQAQFFVQIIRETSALSGEGWAVNMVPDSEQLGDEGTTALDDAGALVKAAIAVHAAIGQGKGFVIDSCSPLGPQGGLSAMRLSITVSLD
jgi:hypothetical protein